MSGSAAPSEPAIIDPSKTPASFTEPPLPGDTFYSEEVKAPEPKAPEKPESPKPPEEKAAKPAEKAEEQPYEDERLKKMWNGKYRTFEAAENAGKSAVAEMHKLSERAAALEMRLGAFKGPPVDEAGKPRPYRIAMPEDSPFTIDVEGEEFSVIQQIFAKHGAPEEMLQELNDQFYYPMMEAQIRATKEVEQANLMDYFGSAEAAVAKTRETQEWLVEHLGAENVPLIKRFMSSSDAIIGASVLRAALENVTLMGKGGASASASVDTEQSILAMRKEHTIDGVETWRDNPQLKARYDRYTQAEAARRSGRTG